MTSARHVAWSGRHASGVGVGIVSIVGLSPDRLGLVAGRSCWTGSVAGPLLAWRSSSRSPAPAVRHSCAGRRSAVFPRRWSSRTADEARPRGVRDAVRERGRRCRRCRLRAGRAPASPAPASPATAPGLDGQRVRARAIRRSRCAYALGAQRDEVAPWLPDGAVWTAVLDRCTSDPFAGRTASGRRCCGTLTRTPARHPIEPLAGHRGPDLGCPSATGACGCPARRSSPRWSYREPGRCRRCAGLR